MCRFSIIVPQSGQLPEFEDTLASVLRHRPMESQVIVVRDASYEDPYDLKNEVDFVAAGQPRRLAGSLNAGLHCARGRITVLIRPGVELDENWEDSILDAFEDSRVGAVTPIIVSNSRQSRIVVAGVTSDRTGTRCQVGFGRKATPRTSKKIRQQGPSSWLAAYRTDVLRAIAPIDQQIDDVYVDIDIARAMKRLGFESQLVPQFVGYVDSAEPIIAETSQSHGKAAQRSLIRFGDGDHATLFNHCLIDLMLSPLKPWRFWHALQRFAAGKLSGIDRQFATHLDELRQEKPWDTSDTRPVVDPNRRAA